MKNKDRKMLTEFLGEVWEEPYLDTKVDWGKTYPRQFISIDHNRTFDKWKDFGALWEKLVSNLTLYSPAIWWMLEHKTPEEKCFLILKFIKEKV